MQGKVIMTLLATDTYYIGKYILKSTKDTNGILSGIFERNHLNKWYFRVISEPINGNKVTLSYDDIKTLLKNYCIEEIDNKQKRVHPLQGEPLIPFNKWIKLNNRFCYIALGWQLQQGFNNNLSDSILVFIKNNNLIEINRKGLLSLNVAIKYNNKYNNNLIRMNEDDNEIIAIDFAKVNYDTHTIAVIIIDNIIRNINTPNVMEAFIKLYDSQQYIGVHVVKNNSFNCIGICLGLFRRNIDGFWYFCAIREIIANSEIIDINETNKSVNDIRPILNKYPLNI